MTEGKKTSPSDWYPVGTGPYMLTVTIRTVDGDGAHPEFRRRTVSRDGEAGDAEAGSSDDAGKSCVHRQGHIQPWKRKAFHWNKFAGYYDYSGISSDTFDQVVQITGAGDIALTEDIQLRRIALQTSVATSTLYMASTCSTRWSGALERARKLRHAISIALTSRK